MSNDLKVPPGYMKGEIVRWAAAQVEAAEQPGCAIPTWMIDGFKEAMEREMEVEAADAESKGQDTEEKEDTQDDVFKFELVYFKVEKTIFTVIKDWLVVDGSPFQAMFTLPATEGSPMAVEGSTITNPIILEQTSAASFKAFLCLLYHGPREKPLQTYDEWVGALDLAIRWNFDQVRKQAIAGLQLLLPSFGPAARIQLARRFSVGPWLRAGLIDLVTEVGKKRLTRSELMAEKDFPLDMTTVANVFYACFELFYACIEGYNQTSEASSETLYCDMGRHARLNGWGPSHVPHCAKCTVARNQARALREDFLVEDVHLKVDDIFGAEIRGCLYSGEL